MKYASCQNPVPPESRMKFCHQMRCGSERVHRSMDSKSFQYHRMPICNGKRRKMMLFSKWSRPSGRSEEHTSELQSRSDLVCRLLLEKKKKKSIRNYEQHLRDKRQPPQTTTERRHVHKKKVPHESPSYRCRDDCLIGQAHSVAKVLYC